MFPTLVISQKWGARPSSLLLTWGAVGSHSVFIQYLCEPFYRVSYPGLFCLSVEKLAQPTGRSPKLSDVGTWRQPFYRLGNAVDRRGGEE